MGAPKGARLQTTPPEHIAEGTTMSTLTILNADMEDSGKYTCLPAQLEAASVNLHVLESKYFCIFFKDSYWPPLNFRALFGSWKKCRKKDTFIWGFFEGYSATNSMEIQQLSNTNQSFVYRYQ
jgi:hypothetical protein